MSNTTKKISFNETPLSVDKLATHVMLLNPNQDDDDDKEQPENDSTEDIFELTDKDIIVDYVKTGVEWYALIFYYVDRGNVNYTDVYVKKDGAIKRVDTESYEHIFEYLNDQEDESGTRPLLEEDKKDVDDSEISNITPISYPKTQYDKELIRVKNVLSRMYNILIGKITLLTTETKKEEESTKNTEIKAFNAKKILADEVEELSIAFLAILNELRTKNEKNMKQMEATKQGNTDIKIRTYVTRFKFNGEDNVGKPFYYPPFNLETNNEFLQKISDYEKKITTIMNNLKGFEMTKEFVDKSKQKTTILLSEIAKLHSDYSEHVVTLLRTTEEEFSVREQALTTFNLEAGKTQKSVEKLVSKFTNDQSSYSDLHTIDNALKNFYGYIKDTTDMLHEKFKHNISELKLQNRQGNFLSLIPLENMSIKPNETVELTNPQHMNYYSMINLIYSIHYMNEYLRNSMHFNHNITLNKKKIEETDHYQMKSFAAKFSQIDTLRTEMMSVSPALDVHVDVGYDNFLYAVEEFMHVFNKLRYHPLIYKFNGLKKEEFNAIFTNTSDFRYISEIDMETMNADFDDETEIDNDPETDYHTYSNREKKNDFEGAKPLSYMDDLEFLQYLTRVSEKRKEDKISRLIQALDSDFRKLKLKQEALVEKEKKLREIKLQIQTYKIKTVELESQHAKKNAKLINLQSDLLVQEYGIYLQKLETNLARYNAVLVEKNDALDKEKKAYISRAIKITKSLIEEANLRVSKIKESETTVESIKTYEKQLDDLERKNDEEIYQDFKPDPRFADDKIKDILQREINKLFKENKPSPAAQGGKQFGGNIKEFSNYNLKKIKQMYLDTVFPKADMFCNFVNDLYTSRTEEHSEKFILLLKQVTSEKACQDNGKIYFDRFYNIDAKTILINPELQSRLDEECRKKRRVNLFHFMSVIFANYSDYFKRNRGIYIRTRFFASLMRSFSKRFKVFQKVIHLFENQEPKFIRRIDHYIDLANKENILTYIKLRSDDPNHYNARFDIYFNRITENKLSEENNLHGTTNNIRFVYPNQDYYDSLLVRYNDDDHKYYTDLSDRKTMANVNSIYSSETKLMSYKISPEIEHCRLQQAIVGKVTNPSIQDEILFAIRKKMNLFPAQMFYQHKTTDNIIFPRYDHHYMLGKFTKIFQPQMSNGEIAKYMNHVVEQLLLHNPVFILGYGASGAGKTSTLIYFKNGDSDKKEGIVIHIANLLAQKGYHDIELCAEEFYDTQTFDAQGNLENPTAPFHKKISVPGKTTGKIQFKYEDGKGFVLADSSYNHTNMHLYRNAKLPDDVFAPSNGGNTQLSTSIVQDASFNITKKFNIGDEMGKIMIHIVDTDRLVKATTNNVNSSRSHTLVYLTFKKTYGSGSSYDGSDDRVEQLKSKVLKEDRLQLIIGDFAGVENKFTCDKPGTIKQFNAIKGDNENNQGFYSQYAIPIKTVYDNGVGGQSGGNPNKKELTMTDVGFETELQVDKDNIKRYIEGLDKPTVFDENTTLTSIVTKINNTSRFITNIGRYFKKMYIDHINNYIRNEEENPTAEKLFQNIEDFLNIERYIDTTDQINSYQAHLSQMIPQKRIVIDYGNDFIQYSKENKSKSFDTLLTDNSQNVIVFDNGPYFLPKIIDKGKLFDGIKISRLNNYFKREKNVISQIAKNNKEISELKSKLLEKEAKYINTVVFLKKQENIIKENKNIDDENMKSEEKIKTAILENSKLNVEFEKVDKEYADSNRSIAEATSSAKSEHEKDIQKIDTALIEAVTIINLEQDSKKNNDDDDNTHLTKIEDAISKLRRESEKTILSEKAGELSKLLKAKTLSLSKFENLKKNLQTQPPNRDIFLEFKTGVNAITNAILAKKNDGNSSGINLLLNQINDRLSTAVKKKIMAFQKAWTYVQDNFGELQKPTVDSMNKCVVALELMGNTIPPSLNSSKVSELVKDHLSNTDIFGTNIPKLKTIIAYRQNIKTNYSTDVENLFKEKINVPDNSTTYQALIDSIEDAKKKETLGRKDDQKISNLKTDIHALLRKSIAIEFLAKIGEKYPQKITEAQTTPENIIAYLSKQKEAFSEFKIPDYIVTPTHIELKTKWEKLQEEKKISDDDVQKLNLIKPNPITDVTVTVEDIQKTISNVEKNKNLIERILTSTINSNDQLNESLKKIQKITGSTSIPPPETKTDSHTPLTIFTYSKEDLIDESTITTEQKETGIIAEDNEMNELLSFKFDKDAYIQEYTEIQYFMMKFVDLLMMARFQYKYMQQICSNRLREGIFINQSLKDMRLTLKDMFAAKSGGKIDTIPYFIETCMKSYCTKYENCFETNEKRIPDFSKIDSVLVKSIFDKIHGNTDNSDTQEDKIKDFYKKLQVCAFCVVNITIDNTANNPPPSPYIDINKLKTIFYSHKNTIFGNPTELKFEFKPSVSKNYEQLSNKTNHKEIRKLFLEECNSVVNIIDNKYNNGGRADFIKTLQSDLIYIEFKRIVKEFSINLMEGTRDPNVEKVRNSDETININKIPLFVNTIENFIEFINNVNATSTIGTLEFMDFFSKYNQTKMLCTVPTGDSPSQYNMIDIKNAILLQNEAFKSEASFQLSKY